LARELGPFAVLRRVLFEPEVAVFVREAAQAGVPEAFRPGLDIREYRYPIPSIIVPQGRSFGVQL
jgi:hypothetical protein